MSPCRRWRCRRGCVCVRERGRLPATWEGGRKEGNLKGHDTNEPSTQGNTWVLPYARTCRERREQQSYKPTNEQTNHTQLPKRDERGREMLGRRLGVSRVGFGRPWNRRRRPTIITTRKLVGGGSSNCSGHASVYACIL